MKNLIRKILKENEDEFEWARGLDVDAAEKEIKKPFTSMEYDYSFEGNDFYTLLIDSGVKDIDHLKDIGQFVYDELVGVHDRGHEGGYDSGRDSCDCDGCCDDYVYIDDRDDQVREARDEGYEEGRDAGYDDGESQGYERGKEDGKEESKDEIEELNGRIYELQSRIEDLENERDN